MTSPYRNPGKFRALFDLSLFFIGTLGGVIFAVAALILTLVWIGYALLAIVAFVGPVLVLIGLGIDLQMARKGAAPKPRPWPFFSITAGAVWPALAVYLLIIER